MNERMIGGGSPEQNKKLVRAGGSDRYPRFELVEPLEEIVVSRKGTNATKADEPLEMIDVKRAGKPKKAEPSPRDITSGETVSGSNKPESGLLFELSKAQRKRLRTLLLTFGLTLTPMKDSGQIEAAYEEGYKVPDGSAEVLDDQRSNIEDEITAIEQTLAEVETTATVEQVPDAFTTEVLQYTAEIKDADVAKTWEYAMKPVVGAPGFSRWDYVQKAIEFEPWDEEKKTGVPPVIVDELRRVLPGLAGQESRFDASRVSKSGAQGIMQFLPTTWESYGGKPEEMISLKRQVEIAGEFISDLHRQLQVHIGTEALQTLRSQFNTEEDFQRHLLVPLILNSYNAGAMRVGVAVKKYVEETPVEEMPRYGPDLFIAIADFAASSDGYLAKYQKEARDYVTKVYGMKHRLELAKAATVAPEEQQRSGRKEPS